MHSGIELLIDSPMAARGRRMLAALADTAPAGTIVTDRYRGGRRLLVVYGVGRDYKFAAMKRQLAAGGHIACWDLGYWDRDDAMRLSIDALHPTEQQLQLAPATGWRREVEIREDAKAHGHILLVGLGRKSAHMYGLSGYEWERARLARIRREHPERRICWRPKGKDRDVLPGTDLLAGMSIDAALRGASLVVCRHSNVAVDACIAGIPVECDDGAAFALYRHGSAPTADERREFLRRLGWWNWRPGEADAAWRWMLEVIER